MNKPAKVPLKLPVAGMRTCHPWLMLDPVHPPTILPEEDTLTRQVDAIMEKAQPINHYKGVHTTPFGVNSDNRDYLIKMPGKDWPIVTNSLASYYIRHHRRDIANKDMELLNYMVEALNIDVNSPEID